MPSVVLLMSRWLAVALVRVAGGTTTMATAISAATPSPMLESAFPRRPGSSSSSGWVRTTRLATTRPSARTPMISVNTMYRGWM